MPTYKKISELTEASTLDGTEKVEIIQGGASRQAPISGMALTAGFILPFAGDTAPAGFLACDGSAVSRTTYANLFAAIGETWGAGDASTTFNVPDLRGAFLRGTGTGTINARNKVGATVGTMVEDAAQGHGHWLDFNDAGSTLRAIVKGGSGASVRFASDAANDSGDGWAVGNMREKNNGAPRYGDETYPYHAGILYCIKT